MEAALSLRPGHRAGPLQRRSTALLTALRDASCIATADGRLTEVNDSFCELVGLPAEAILSNAPPHAFWPNEDLQLVREAFFSARREGGQFALHMARPGVERFPVTVDVSPLGRGELLCVVRETRERELLREAHEVARLASFEWDRDSDALEISERLIDIAGLAPQPGLDDLLGRAPAAHRRELRDALERLADGRASEMTLECPVAVPNPELRWVEVRARPAHPSGRVRGTIQDVTARVESERRVREARDHLRAVTDSIGEGICTFDRSGRLTYLNRAGERLLDHAEWELLGRSMREVFPADGVIVRRDGSERPAEISSTPLDGESGRPGSVVVFSDIAVRLARQRRLEDDFEDLAWVARILTALTDDRFVLHAQPIVDVVTGETVQHELLIRMLDEDGRELPPAAFLPVAERHGLIVDIDRWVVGEAVRLAARGHRIQLNLSAASIADPELLEDFRAAVQLSGADPSYIVVELTETALVADDAAAKVFVEQIRALGCRLALDDFGTGYGGFSYLKRLPVDCLKIDLEFVSDLATNEASPHVVKAVVSLAQGFGLETVAEGVEDDETLVLLRELGVTRAQGYGIARPAPAKRVLGLA